MLDVCVKSVISLIPRLYGGDLTTWDDEGVGQAETGLGTRLVSYYLVLPMSCGLLGPSANGDANVLYKLLQEKDENSITFGHTATNTHSLW